ncbi:hypothetical protein [Flavobacterium sp. MDT1-60]|uniref:hypothetical protein n=1 Tax=Flavobacterium sp. MDT1-60 TaxID=1979344 RepID=UPI00177B8D94|nr:hypothetical protein [Flavobacterium sp. MDT1-60]QOG03549.1 hypothetical protein IHE43_04730 [Flavobacterium sp. MDT1-60]
MKKLELNQMADLQASGCGWSAIGLGLTFAGAFLVTGPIGAGLFAASFIHGSIALAQDCGTGGSRPREEEMDR